MSIDLIILVTVFLYLLSTFVYRCVERYKKARAKRRHQYLLTKTWRAI